MTNKTRGLSLIQILSVDSADGYLIYDIEIVND